ncbi:MocR-like pyridoxine biosynthesis transcription factor PdxR [Acidocella aminolytica]|uniref:Transcriptional regulator GntR/aminotransferase n=1 Tax=Acidocella aminolytica 101 = DSM 11237 TaxID=1120923 RepID=A0A0D6PLB9_9PROT|nr:PLP-dependent aminotransferase family protein [Acidocella aminolytica]GAN82013.1 transcriptional regulator GntR/aminotransferase [Acidocella aminolytica 101 = DSM 11237]SHF46482.1 GntR family transcriptional regulator / MocR family aminotransferase [Acidocella aminolytica 101 = DSM 11237]
MSGQSQTALVTLNRDAGDLQGQLYRALRARILGGGLRAGTRLPSTRQFAVSLGVARATVVGAYERLHAEGYLLSAAGKASRVANIVPPKAPVQRPIRTAHTSVPKQVLCPSQLAPGVPDLTSFPSALWGRLQGAETRRLVEAALGYGAPFGLPALKEAILAHISVTRGVAATPEQIVLFPSARTAIAVIARAVMRCSTRESASVWIEDPAYPKARQILHAAGGQLVPIPVDHWGLDPEQVAHLPPPCLIYVTPSHQYPTGVTMSLARRLRLLEFARQSGAFILEDDYDSEFQFDGRPIAALQGIDPAGRVAYIGTLSKVLAPGVRLAYAVLPQSLLAEIQQALSQEGLAVSVHVQATFLAFLRDGYFGAHIKRMTERYATRMKAFRAAIERFCSTYVQPGPGAGGLQLALWFKDQGINDNAIAEALTHYGYAPEPLSSMYLGPSRSGLLCGIASLLPDQAPIIASDIATVLSSSSSSIMD